MPDQLATSRSGWREGSFLRSESHGLDAAVHPANTVAALDSELNEASVTPPSAPGVLDEPVVDFHGAGRDAAISC